MKLNPPVVENKSPAQTSQESITIPFQMNKSVGWADFSSVIAIVKTVQTNSLIATLECDKGLLYLKNGIYYANLSGTKTQDFKIGQYYKVQLAYVNIITPDDPTTEENEEKKEIGFFSSTTTFKFTSSPEVNIQNLENTTTPNFHQYSYTGHYSNVKDPSEKVYSYQFDLYEMSGELIASSGEQLHNSSKDTETTSSIDEWTTRYGLQSDLVYLIRYKVKTINGLEISSPSYKIIDHQTVPSNVFKYCDFVAENIADSACVELSLKPKSGKLAADRKLLNGKFILLRASNEDSFKSWHELTRFTIASWDSGIDHFICKDYSVSQGVEYIYALQAYNNQGIYSERENSPLISVDFEDMFLSDGERQLRIKYNPKVSSIKNTILESKLDTLGGKYPFFFRNGNVKYKEFPISGLISMLMDENEEFMSGIQLTNKSRLATPADSTDFDDLTTSLTGTNFRKERDFKFEVLEWLTNGKPKLFRSPGEGSYIVRLMNTSLTPNDTLSRMLHTFQSTAYEIADFTFENLRKYGMMMDEYIETRELLLHNIHLEDTSNGIISNINACMATVNATPNTEFYYKLQGDESKSYLQVGVTGVYTFSKEVLQETPLIEIGHDDGKDGWMPGATLSYGTYAPEQVNDFSYIHSITITDEIGQWIGQSADEISMRFDENQIRTSMGTAYYINIQKRDFIPVDNVIPIGGNRYKFEIGGIAHYPGNTDILFYDDKYYDGRTSKLIGSYDNLNFDFKLREDGDVINFLGTNLDEKDNATLVQYGNCEAITSIGGRLILNNVRNIDYLFLGNGLYIDIAYQKVHKVYTVEVTPGTQVKIAKDKWLKTKDPDDYDSYYNLLTQYLKSAQEGLTINAIE